MKGDQRTLRMLALALPQELPPPPGILSLVHLDGVTWHRVRLSDGTPGWTGKCPCGRTLHSGFRRVKPSSIACGHCGKWTRLP